MPDERAAPATWYAAFDTLRQAHPMAAAALAARFPAFSNEILGRRVFGAGDGADSDADRRLALGRDAVEAVCTAVTQSLDEALTITRRRARLLARARLGAGFVALLCSAGVLGALSQNSPPMTVISATGAAVAAALNLFVSYYEDQSGGDGSITRLREILMEQVSALAEIRGKLALGLLAHEDASVLSFMGELNAISARLQMARAQLGLPLTIPGMLRP